jgi:hypothetical protein
MKSPKPEIRYPKEVQRPKSECGGPVNNPALWGWGTESELRLNVWKMKRLLPNHHFEFRPSVFGFRSGFGLRISALDTRTSDFRRT